MPGPQKVPPRALPTHPHRLQSLGLSPQESNGIFAPNTREPSGANQVLRWQQVPYQRRSPSDASTQRIGQCRRRNAGQT